MKKEEKGRQRWKKKDDERGRKRKMKKEEKGRQRRKKKED